jgi:BASS family bile acid:Na+ symporter
MLSGFARTAAILVAFLLGAVLPQAHAAAGAIQWLIIGMLFLVFLGTTWTFQSIRRSQLVLLAANLFMAFAGLGLGWLVGGRDVGLAGFFAGIAPTAAAAPVIISFMRRDVTYVTAAFLLTNVVIAALLPVLLPWVLGEVDATLFRRIAGSIVLLIFTPLALALIVRRLHPQSITWPGRIRDVSFGAWMATLFLVMANASHFLRTQAGVSRLVLLEIAAVTLAVCVANFALGRWIGGRTHAAEASQSLGQKNTSFTLYLALAYASPLVALGPTCYILCHNLWNGWQLHRVHRPARRKPTPAPPDPLSLNK